MLNFVIAAKNRIRLELTLDQQMNGRQISYTFPYFDQLNATISFFSIFFNSVEIAVVHIKMRAFNLSSCRHKIRLNTNTHFVDHFLSSSADVNGRLCLITHMRANMEFDNKLTIYSHQKQIEQVRNGI